MKGIIGGFLIIALLGGALAELMQLLAKLCNHVIL
jgi:hypothetical protein